MNYSILFIFFLIFSSCASNYRSPDSKSLKQLPIENIHFTSIENTILSDEAKSLLLKKIDLEFFDYEEIVLLNNKTLKIPVPKGATLSSEEIKEKKRSGKVFYITDNRNFLISCIVQKSLSPPDIFRQIIKIEYNDAQNVLSFSESSLTKKIKNNAYLNFNALISFKKNKQLYVDYINTTMFRDFNHNEQYFCYSRTVGKESLNKFTESVMNSILSKNTDVLLHEIKINNNPVGLMSTWIKKEKVPTFSDLYTNKQNSFLLASSIEGNLIYKSKSLESVEDEKGRLIGIDYYLVTEKEAISSQLISKNIEISQDFELNTNNNRTLISQDIKLVRPRSVFHQQTLYEKLAKSKRAPKIFKTYPFDPSKFVNKQIPHTYILKKNNTDFLIYEVKNDKKTYFIKIYKTNNRYEIKQKIADAVEIRYSPIN